MNLLSRIRDDRDRMSATPAKHHDEPSSKRARKDSSASCGARTLTTSSPPYLIAPPKVMEYLKLLLDDPDELFQCVRPDCSGMMESAFADINKSLDSLSFLFWDNIRVDHSCAHAYGCVFAIRTRAQESPFLFCFSGDTRPSRNLVQVCRDVSARYASRIDVVLHEATFDEEEIEMCRKKKHSTVQEAVLVGRDIDARRLLLTHFSQRYDSVPAIDVESERFEGRMQVGFALDGIAIPLFSI